MTYLVEVLLSCLGLRGVEGGVQTLLLVGREDDEMFEAVEHAHESIHENLAHRRVQYQLFFV
jgi:hypothetical protein